MVLGERLEEYADSKSRKDPHQLPKTHERGISLDLGDARLVKSDKGAK
jgi:hypothetical protein